MPARARLTIRSPASRSSHGRPGRSSVWLLGLGLALVVCGLAPAAGASDVELAQEDRIAELERKLDALADELERSRTQGALPDQNLEGFWGLGPAASKVYALSRGVTLGGYAEGRYTAHVSDKGGNQNEIDALRAVLYVGYKFNDWLVWNSEIEIEHASTSEDGSVSLEFAALDFLFHPALNARVGLLLSPMGFLNEVHEPPFYFGTHRPEVARRIIPTTWRENGFGIFGELWGGKISYRLYGINGFDATGFSPSGLRGGRQKGSKALAEDFAFVGRLDWTPFPEFLLGASVYAGDSGQDQRLDVKNSSGVVVDIADIPNAATTIWEVHAQLRTRGWQLRALFAQAHVSDAGDLSRALEALGDLNTGQAVASKMLGGYAEIAYDVWPLLAPGSPMSLEPFYRFGFVDTQRDIPTGFAKDEAQNDEFHTLGFSFKPVPNVVLKADYRNRSAEQGGLSDEINLGVGLVF